MNVIWGYQFYLWSVSYILLGMGALCLLLELENGIVAVMTVLFYPLYSLLIMAVWSFVGSIFEETVRKRKDVLGGFFYLLLFSLQTGDLIPTLFNSKWPDMSPSYRKIVIILMSLAQTELRMEVRPFYILNRETFYGVRTDKLTNYKQKN